MKVNTYCDWKAFENIFNDEIISGVHSFGIDISF
jgi:hypothetical protein